MLHIYVKSFFTGNCLASLSQLQNSIIISIAQNTIAKRGYSEILKKWHTVVQVK